MSNQGYFKQNMLRSPTTAGTYTAISGAAPQTVTGNAISIPNPLAGSGNAIATGSLSALVVANITANTMTVSGKWQVSADGSTWYNCANAPQNAAAVAIATGTGSLVTTSLVVPAPDSVYGWSKARFVLTTGAAAGGGAGIDEAAISYNYRVAPAR
jgi:hypothetical protein